MDALIKVKVSELNAAFLERIKSLFQGKEDAELTITFSDKQYQYFKTLGRSKNDLETGRDLVSFTMEELEAYTVNRKKT